MTRRKRPAPSITNVYVQDGGKRYRVALHYGARPLLVALKCPAGGERLLEPTGRRYRKIAAMAVPS